LLQYLCDVLLKGKVNCLIIRMVLRFSNNVRNYRVQVVYEAVDFVLTFWLIEGLCTLINIPVYYVNLALMSLDCGLNRL